jgi:hypothetical protein
MNARIAAVVLGVLAAACGSMERSSGEGSASAWAARRPPRVVVPPPGTFVPRNAFAGHDAAAPSRRGLVALDQQYLQLAIVDPASAAVVAMVDGHFASWLEDDRLLTLRGSAPTLWSAWTGRGKELPLLPPDAQFENVIRVGERDLIVYAMPTGPDGNWDERTLYLRDLASSDALLAVDPGAHTVLALGLDAFMSVSKEGVIARGLDGKERFRYRKMSSWPVPQVGRDGRYVLLGRRELRRIADGTVVRRLVADGPLHFSPPGHLSPPGTHLLEVRAGGVEIVDLGSGTARRLADGPVERVGWSHDGTRVAWMQGDDVMLADIDPASGDAPRKIARVEQARGAPEIRGEIVIAHASSGTYAIDLSGKLAHTDQLDCDFGPPDAPARVATCYNGKLVTLGATFADVELPRDARARPQYHPRAGLHVGVGWKGQLFTPDGGAPGPEAQRREKEAQGVHFAADTVLTVGGGVALVGDVATGAARAVFDVSAIASAWDVTTDAVHGGIVAWNETELGRWDATGALRWKAAHASSKGDIVQNGDRVIVTSWEGPTEVRALDDGRVLKTFPGRMRAHWPGKIAIDSVVAEGEVTETWLVDLATFAELRRPVLRGTRLTPDGRWILRTEPRDVRSSSLESRHWTLEDVQTGAPMASSTPPS